MPLDLRKGFRIFMGHGAAKADAGLMMMCGAIGSESRRPADEGLRILLQDLLSALALPRPQQFVE